MCSLLEAGAANVRIIDMLGRTLKEASFEVKSGYELLELQLNGLNPGFYQLAVRRNGEEVVGKFIKR
jgi:hypothetical protein